MFDHDHPSACKKTKHIHTHVYASNFILFAFSLRISQPSSRDANLGLAFGATRPATETAQIEKETFQPCERINNRCPRHAAFVRGRACSQRFKICSRSTCEKITGKQSRLRCSQGLSTSHPAGVAPAKMQHYHSTHEDCLTQSLSSEPPNDAVQREKMSAGDCNPRRITQTPQDAGLPAP